MILGSVLWSCSWGHWFLGVSSTLSQLSLEKWGSCGLQRWRWELGDLGKEKGEAEWLWFLGLWISASQCGDSESGRLRWRKKGIGSNNPLFRAGLIFNYQRCSAENDKSSPFTKCMQCPLLPSCCTLINPLLEQEMCFKHKGKVKLNKSVLSLCQRGSGKWQGQLLTFE